MNSNDEQFELYSLFYGYKINLKPIVHYMVMATFRII